MELMRRLLCSNNGIKRRTNRYFRGKSIVGIYLSGTGNTKHYVEKLMELLAQSAQSILIEGKETANLLTQHDVIVLTYPVQFSNTPVMVRDFIKDKALCNCRQGIFWQY